MNPPPPNQWSGFTISSSTTGFMMEDRLCEHSATTYISAAEIFMKQHITGKIYYHRSNQLQ